MSSPIPIPISSDSSSSDFDAVPIRRPPKRSRKSSAVAPDPDIVALCASQFADNEAIKVRLRDLNPHCVPRIRSTSGPDGRHVRFKCKNEHVAPHHCRLNVSAIKTVNGGVTWLMLSSGTYHAGTCRDILCICCGDNLILNSFVCCDGSDRHHLCDSCFNDMVCRLLMSSHVLTGKCR